MSFNVAVLSPTVQLHCGSGSLVWHALPLLERYVIC